MSGRTDWIFVLSEKGEPRVLHSDMELPLKAEPNTVQLHSFNDGSVSIELKAGQSAVVYSAAQGVPQPDFTIQPSPGNKVSYRLPCFKTTVHVLMFAGVLQFLGSPPLMAGEIRDGLHERLCIFSK